MSAVLAALKRVASEMEQRYVDDIVVTANEEISILDERLLRRRLLPALIFVSE